MKEMPARNPMLDVLRGIAITLVLCYHNFQSYHITRWGWVGVDLFFVLSGFLITGIIVQSRDHKSWLRNFYIRRFLRILPLYYLFLLLAILVFPLLSKPPYDVMYYRDNQVWFWTFFQNWLFILKHPEPQTFLNHFWSLAVEEQFYCVWPLVIWRMQSAKKMLVCLWVLFLLLTPSRLLVAVYQPFDISYQHLFTFSRIDGLLAGSMAALLQHQQKPYKQALYRHFALLAAATALLLLPYGFATGSLAVYPELVLYPAIALGFATLLVHLLNKYQKAAPHTGNKYGFGFMGKISYSLYVLHWPVYLVLTPKLHHWVTAAPVPLITNLLIPLSATVIAVGLSFLSYRFFEQHFLKLKEKLAPVTAHA